MPYDVRNIRQIPAVMRSNEVPTEAGTSTACLNNPATLTGIRSQPNLSTRRGSVFDGLGPAKGHRRNSEPASTKQNNVLVEATNAEMHAIWLEFSNDRDVLDSVMKDAPDPVRGESAGSFTPALTPDNSHGHASIPARRESFAQIGARNPQWMQTPQTIVQTPKLEVNHLFVGSRYPQPAMVNNPRTVISADESHLQQQIRAVAEARTHQAMLPAAIQDLPATRAYTAYLDSLGQQLFEEFVQKPPAEIWMRVDLALTTLRSTPASQQTVEAVHDLLKLFEGTTRWAFMHTLPRCCIMIGHLPSAFDRLMLTQRIQSIASTESLEFQHAVNAAINAAQPTR